ncbi:MAG: winged helix-turn-helix domain-containing protein [Prevotella sp.]|nr:winged helix-turn-helix domain-containing protein [Prevotella sp.]MDO5526109.1 winged helix-turn-helix domain-containing protein [Prevotella sp.]
MAEKKTTKATAAKTKAVAEKAPAKKCATKKCAAKATTDLTAEVVGFKAGDVYQALAAAGVAMSVAEIAKAAKISTEETYLGIGWLLKEGKVVAVEDKLALA